MRWGPHGLRSLRASDLILKLETDHRVLGHWLSGGRAQWAPELVALGWELPSLLVTGSWPEGGENLRFAQTPAGPSPESRDRLCQPRGN